MKKLDALFISNGGVGLPTLKALNASDDVKSLRVITNGKPEGLTAKTADELGVHCDFFEPDRDNSDRNQDILLEMINDTGFDVAMVLSFGHILGEETLEAHRGKLFNTHFSALPKWRGAAPVERAILAGEESFGLTIQEMVRRVDAGRIAAQRRFHLGEKTAREVYGTLAEEAGTMTPSFLSLYRRGKLDLTPQDEREATKAPKIEKSELMVSVGECRDLVWRKFRAFHFRGLSIRTNRGILKIIDMTDQPTPEGFRVDFPGGPLWLTKVVFPGKKPIGAGDLLNGYQDLDFNVPEAA